MDASTRVTRIEEVLVGVFGAFIGGEFVAAMLNAGKAPTTFTASGLLYAVLSAVTLLALLVVMRRAVGPMRSRRKPTRGGR